MAIAGIFLLLFGVFVLAAAFMHLAALVLVLMLIPVIMFSFVFWIWMLIDAIKNENIGGNERVAWVIAICLTHWFGALIYFFATRSRRRVLAPPRLMQA